MATNFSITDTAVQSFIDDGGINVTRYRRMSSAVIQAVQATGGKMYPNLAPVPTRIPVFSGQADINGTAESAVGGSNSKPNSARAATGTNLLVEAYAEFEKTTDQALMAGLHGVMTPQAYAAGLIAEKSPAIYAGFDADVLGDLAGATDIEWDAADPIGTLSSALATYDETDYNGDAMILTRRGARQMGLAVDTQGRIQFTGMGSMALPLDIPVFMTDSKSADIGVSNLLAVIGPFASCAVGMAGATRVKTFDQLEPTAGGAQENIITFCIERYLGFAKPPTSVIPATGWTTITDDV
jgi:hypothetical protein